MNKCCLLRVMHAETDHVPTAHVELLSQAPAMDTQLESSTMLVCTIYSIFHLFTPKISNACHAELFSPQPRIKDEGNIFDLAKQ